MFNSDCFVGSRRISCSGGVKITSDDAERGVRCKKNVPQNHKEFDGTIKFFVIVLAVIVLVFIWLDEYGLVDCQTFSNL